MKNKIANAIIIFASLNTALSLFRLYHYFFTGTDITPVSGEAAGLVTFGMCVVSIFGYLIGFVIKQD